MNTFLQVLFFGGAQGAALALVALGFVIIYKATGVINFAQGGFMLIGAYLAYNCHVTWGIPFWPSVILAMIGTALVGVLIEELVLRFLVGQPVFAQVMVTIGLLFVIQEVTSAIWGIRPLDMDSPWSTNPSITVGDTVVSEVWLWTIGIALAAVAVFFAFFRFSRFGLAMRATALDQEAALAQGISARRVYALSWAIAGAVGALSAVMLAAPANALNPGLQFFALVAFPAIILGGLDSPGGAIIGGLIIGLSQQWAAKWKDWQAVVDALGHWTSGIDVAFPYIVMVAVLLVKPYGLFGTKEVKRV